MPHPRTFPLEIIRDHTVARIGSAAALIDTGSPRTFRATDMISAQLGEPIRWLVGTDVLRRRRVLLDWIGRRIILDGADPIGEEIPLIAYAGVYQVEVTGQHGTALAFLDTGAHLSYAPDSAVRGLTPTGHHRDFHPVIGVFDVPVYELDIQVGDRLIRGRFGVLASWMADPLGLVTATGWILGSDFFRDRAIQLDLGRNRLIDAALATTLAEVQA